MNLNELQVKAEQLGYRLDALLATTDGYVVVLEDSMGATLEFSAPTPNGAVDRANEALGRSLGEESR
jgi:hypothetical protein